MIREAEQLRPFGPQLRDLQNHRTVVDAAVAAKASVGGRFPDFLTQRSVVQRWQNGHAGGISNLQQILAFESTLFRAFGCCCNTGSIEAIELCHVIDDDRSLFSDGQQIFLEFGFQLR